MQSSESDIPAPVLTGILAAGYCGVLVAGMILERLGVPAAIIQWFVIAGALAPFLLLGLLSGTMQTGSFAGKGLQGGLVHDAAGLAGAVITGGMMFLASRLAVSDPALGLILVAGVATGIGLHGFIAPPGTEGSPVGSPAWQLSRATGNRQVRLVAGLFLALLALGVLAAQFRILVLMLDVLFPAMAPAHWLVAAGIGLAGAWTGGFSSASRSLPFSFAIVFIGLAAPLAVLTHAAGDLTWAEFFAGVPETGVVQGGLPVLPLAVSTWEWGIEPASGWSAGLALFATMVLTGMVLALLLPAANGGKRQGRRRSVPLLAAGLVLLAVMALVVNARTAGMIAGGSLTDIPAGLIGEEAGWLFRDGMNALAGFVDICGVPATSPGSVRAACGAADHVLTAADIRLNPVTAFLLPAAAFGMPAVMWPAILLAVVLASAGTAAAMLAAIGRLMAEGGAVPRAGRSPRPASRRLAMARAGMLAAGAGAAWLGTNGGVRPFDHAIWPGSLTISALAIPFLAMGWRKKLHAAPVMAAMFAGAMVPALVLAARALMAFPDAVLSDTTSIEWLAAMRLPDAVLLGAVANLCTLVLGSLMVRDGTRRQTEEIAQ
ncbi:hypothetical protein [Zhengella sedimenti]|uniref:hypothetical protein n=1 Tax=Zhengella sedimenti TaxID=3390035 RepID=UPI0039768231